VSCDEERCITCSDEAVSLRVVESRMDGVALCEGQVEVMTDLIGDVIAGETLLVHAGVALAKVEA
jgi:hydrogenase maturation factor